jgi:hypothetical protein
VDVAVAPLDEHNLGGGTMPFARLREELLSLLKEELKALTIIPRLQILTAQRLSRKMLQFAVSLFDKFPAIPPNYRIDHRSSCLLVWKNSHLGRFRQAGKELGEGYRTPLTELVLQRYKDNIATQEVSWVRLIFSARWFTMTIAMTARWFFLLEEEGSAGCDQFGTSGCQRRTTLGRVDPIQRKTLGREVSRLSS